MMEYDQQPDYPDNPMPELINILWDAGPVIYGGMGAEALTSLELEAYQRGSGVKLTPWEFGVIRRLSGAYLSQLIKSSKPSCPAPFRAAPTPESRAALERKIRASMQL